MELKLGPIDVVLDRLRAGMGANTFHFQATAVTSARKRSESSIFARHHVFQETVREARILH